jgi:hypothetical protein
MEPAQWFFTTAFWAEVRLRRAKNTIWDVFMFGILLVTL